MLTSAGQRADPCPTSRPGVPTAAYLAATAALVIGFLAKPRSHMSWPTRWWPGRHGAPAEEIRIGFFGGAAHGRHEYATPRGLWRAAAAGPAASLVLAAAGAGIALGLAVLGAGRLPVVVFAALAWINTILAVVNLLPGAGLDGGQLVAGAGVGPVGGPGRAAITAARVGQFAGVLLIAGGVTALALGYLVDGIWPGLIGLAMISASRAQAREVHGHHGPGGPARARRSPAVRLRHGRHSRAGRRCSRSSRAGPLRKPGSWERDGQRSGRRAGRQRRSAFPLRDFDGRAAGAAHAQPAGAGASGPARPAAGSPTWPPRPPTWSPPP